MRDHRWESLDAAEEQLLDEVLRAGREELPDEAHLRVIEGRLGDALAKEAATSAWWSPRLYPVVGLAVVALGVRAGSSWLSTPSPVASSALPTSAATEPAPVVEPPPSTRDAIVAAPMPPPPSLSVESLPAAKHMPGPEHDAPKAPDKTTSVRSGSARPQSARPVAAATSLDDELTLLEEASHALDEDPARAFALTDEHKKRFRAPKLAQERERLAIVALVRLGRQDEAERRADAFEAGFPDSPHLTRVRALVRP